MIYSITPDQVNGTQARTDDYCEDPLVKTGSATLNDYKGSGYDRGHLCPAGSMKQNFTSMSETFYLSNISIKLTDFNGGIRLKLEDLVRS